MTKEASVFANVADASPTTSTASSNQLRSGFVERVTVGAQVRPRGQHGVGVSRDERPQVARRPQLRHNSAAEQSPLLIWMIPSKCARAASGLPVVLQALCQTPGDLLGVVDQVAHAFVPPGAKVGHGFGQAVVPERIRRRVDVADRPLPHHLDRRLHALRRVGQSRQVDAEADTPSIFRAFDSAAGMPENPQRLVGRNEA
ncbi:hypothetical protein [Saccharopolyspora sp. 7B]|uniref:hypothetical protein n=1 Tax=Saccharopolyspora sp. 7B TaxID=2877240 RepID=UPI001CD70D02|nr:hypothetical protein [Saccharopolyspora sp. 7B]MCA1278366.1 hypothetical protein [Saccharopolyspora sp. 7B]